MGSGKNHGVRSLKLAFRVSTHSPFRHPDVSIFLCPHWQAQVKMAPSDGYPNASMSLSPLVSEFYTLCSRENGKMCPFLCPPASKYTRSFAHGEKR